VTEQVQLPRHHLRNRFPSQRGRDQVIVLIADDGVGFDVQQVKVAGRALDNTKRCAAQIDGRIEIESDPGGTELRIVLPVHRSEKTPLD
jgi:signal transduction histidine kinase